MTTDPQPAQAPRPAETPSGQPVLETPPDQPAPLETPPGQPSPPEQAAPGQPAHALPHHRIKRTRTGGIWVAVGFFAVILLLLLIFILQNGQKVDISYMGAHGHLPLGVALLLAAVCGVLLVVLAGTARIGQLRATARRHRRADAERVAAAAGKPAGPAR
jgi:lipopolysaccharide assembly protein A